MNETIKDNRSGRRAKLLFRLLVMSLLFIFALGGVEEEGTIPNPLGENDLAALSDAGSRFYCFLITRMFNITITTGLLLLTSMVGLLLFWNKARCLFLVSIVLLFALLPPSISLGSRWWMVLDDIAEPAFILAIIVMMFTRPTSHFFSAKHNKQISPTVSGQLDRKQEPEPGLKERTD